jgi:hypothetical protein
MPFVALGHGEVVGASLWLDLMMNSEWIDRAWWKWGEVLVVSRYEIKFSELTIEVRYTDNKPRLK